MKVSHFFHDYYLHDSVIDKLHYLPTETQLILKMVLSNWMQDWFEEGDQEQIPGRLIFSGVQRVESNLALDQFCEGQRMGARILDGLHIPDRDSEGLEAVEFVISCWENRTHTEDILVLEFLAANVEWLPDE